MATSESPSVIETLKNALYDLTDEDITDFKLHLRDRALLGKFEVIRKGKLEKKSRAEIVEVMLDSYGIFTIDVVERVLRAMHKHSTADELCECDYDPKEIIKECNDDLKSELRERFMFLSEGVSSKEQMEFNEGYTELFITEGDSGRVNQEHEVRQMERDSRRSGQEKTVRCQDIFKGTNPRGKPIRLVLTKGVAGAGKTVLTQKFSLDWAEDRAHQDVQLLFHFTFRELNLLRHSQYTLVELLHRCFSETKALISLQYLQLLFIFDGLDECWPPLNFNIRTRDLTDPTESASVEVLLVNLIRGNLLPSARLWITTRPAAANQIPGKCVSMVTEVRGFTDEQKEHYFRNRFRDEQQAKAAISHIKSSRSLFIMCHLPVVCWIISDVLLHLMETGKTEELPTTLTEMYIHFLVVQAKAKNTKFEGREESDDPWTSDNREMVRALAKLAFEQLLNGKLIFYQSNLSECGLDAEEIARYSGVFTQVFKEEPGEGKNKVYCFIHLSVHEFLAALHVHQTFYNSGENLLSLPHSSESPNPEENLLSPSHSSESPDPQENLLSPPHSSESPDPQENLLSSPHSISKTSSKQSPKRSIFQMFKRKETKPTHSSSSSSKSLGSTATLYFQQLSKHSIFQIFKRKESPETFGHSALDPKTFHRSAVDPAIFGRSALDPKTFHQSAVDPKTFYRSAVDQALQNPNGHLDLFLRFLLGLSLLTNQRLLQALLTETGSDRTNQETVKYINQKLDEEGMSAERSLNLLHCLNELNDRSLVEQIQRVMRVGRLTYRDMSLAQWCALSFLLLCSDSDLEHFDLRKYCPSEEGLMGLLPVVKASTKVTLSGCGLTSGCCGPLTSVFSSSSLTHLDLSNNDLQDSGVELLCEGLKSNPCRLHTLRLSGCLVSESGGLSLAATLSSAPFHLSELDLSYNHPASSIKQLTALKASQRPLQTLRLDPAGERWMVPGLRKYACEVSLDPNTVHRRLLLSEDHRSVTRVEEEQPYPDHNDRFTNRPQVLSSSGLRGHCYWEVDWSVQKEGGVFIAVSYRGISRRGGGGESAFGNNHQSWSLWMFSGGKCSVRHNDKETEIPGREDVSSGRVGVFLDWEGGALSFYDVVSGGGPSHIYTFSTAFTEELLPGFRLWKAGDSVTLVDLNQH